VIVKDIKNCRKCGACMHACPNHAIEIDNKDKEEK
jgi:NAD-dependent dihydropyrimidine dehydrogenase PreA subunit